MSAVDECLARIDEDIATLVVLVNKMRATFGDDSFEVGVARTELRALVDELRAILDKT